MKASALILKLQILMQQMKSDPDVIINDFGSVREIGDVRPDNISGEEIVLETAA